MTIFLLLSLLFIGLPTFCWWLAWRELRTIQARLLRAEGAIRCLVRHGDCENCDKESYHELMENYSGPDEQAS